MTSSILMQSFPDVPFFKVPFFFFLAQFFFVSCLVRVHTCIGSSREVWCVPEDRRKTRAPDVCTSSFPEIPVAWNEAEGELKDGNCKPQALVSISISP